MAFPRHLFGLPLHPLLVHFPIVFWLASPALTAAALIDPPGPWWALSLIASAAGVAFGAAALATGLLDYLHASGTAVRLAASHGVRTSLAWCLVTAKLLVACFIDPSTPLMTAALLIDLVACALLLHGVWLGTRLVYRYGAGRARQDY